jgi:hypothetical protein
MSKTTKRETVLVDCGRCVKGTFYYTGGSGACFTCHGTGKLRMSAAKHAELVAHGERMKLAQAAEIAHEHAEEAAYQEALAAIYTGGVEAARKYFAEHRNDADAIAGLIGAMRDSELVEESNAVVRFRNAMSARGGRP